MPHNTLNKKISEPLNEASLKNIQEVAHQMSSEASLSTNIKVQLVDPKQMNPEELQLLIDEIYLPHNEIFDGAEKSFFAKHVFDTEAEETLVRVYRDGAGKVVGFLGFHIFEVELNGNIAAVLRMEAGMVSEHRRNNVNVGFILTQIAKYKFKHPTRQMFFLGIFIHPSSYAGFSKYASGQTWPRPHRETPPHITSLMNDLKERFKIQSIDPANPYVVHIGVITKDSVGDSDYWKSSHNPHIQFFMQRNPRYAEGNGLLTLIPITFPAFINCLKLLISQKIFPKKRRELRISKESAENTKDKEQKQKIDIGQSRKINAQSSYTFLNVLLLICFMSMLICFI